MARIRSVHPGLWTDESYVSVSPLARLLHIGIWNECDDMGAFEWKPITLKMRLLPNDNADLSALLAELAGVNMVARYTVDGRDYGAVRNFGRFQRPKKPKSVHPMPAEWRKYAASEAAGSEPDDDDAVSGSPPVKDEPSPVPPKSELAAVETPKVPLAAETGPQMEDGGDKGRREEADRSLRSLPQTDPGPPFDAWWERYPRKVGKDAARRAYAAAVRRGAAPSTLLTALAMQRWPDDPQFVPHPTTWLNGGRWQDDPEASAPPQVQSRVAPQRETPAEARRRMFGPSPFLDLDGDLALQPDALVIDHDFDTRH